MVYRSPLSVSRDQGSKGLKPITPSTGGSSLYLGLLPCSWKGVCLLQLSIAEGAARLVRRGVEGRLPPCSLEPLCWGLGVCVGSLCTLGPPGWWKPSRKERLCGRRQGTPSVLVCGASQPSARPTEGAPTLIIPPLEVSHLHPALRSSQLAPDVRLPDPQHP